MITLMLLLPLAGPPETRLEALRRLERESGGYSYFAFARQALGDPTPPLTEATPPDPFGLLSGAQAIDESLALKRAHKPIAAGKRDIAVSAIAGTTIAEHPWEKMMGDKKPRPEPLADIVPYDHWYLTVPSVAKLAELVELTDVWGGSALRVVQVQDRDYRLRERYERQLGVTLDAAKKVPAKLVRAVALVGSDLFFVEGTDVSLIIDTPDPAALVKALGSPKHQVIAGRVVLSNSRTAMDRIRKTAAKERPSLRASLDFRYMRTVFERGDEDGFVFLSDAFIRALVSPATRIKMMRRAEARAAMTLTNHAALFRTIEGRDPGVKVPEPEAGWGTLAEGTPLIDVPIGNVSREEESEYRAFRADYDRLWRQFFDPVGIRWRIAAKEIKAEAYILPLVRSAGYDGLRRFGGETMKADPARLGPTAAAVRFGGKEWFAAQLDDGPDLPRWLEGLITGKAANVVPPFVMTVGVPKADTELTKLADMVNDWLTRQKKQPLVDRHLETSREFRGVTIRRVPINPIGYAEVRRLVIPLIDAFIEDTVTRLTLLSLFPPLAPPAYHTAWIGDGYHVAFDGEALERRITAWKSGVKPEGTEVNAGLMVSRRSGHLAAFLERILERQIRAKADAAATMWQLLLDAKIITAAMTDAQREAVALRRLGFVPAVPDGGRFDFAGGKARARRTAGLSAGGGPDPSSALGRLVRSLKQVSADLRFREDGVHTVVTFTRE